jgi:tetratricopeptide (TPR) repeat protein
LGDHSGALDCFSKALALDTMLYGSNSSRIATRLTNISQTLSKMGRTEEAIHFGQKAIEGAVAGQSVQSSRVPSRFLNLSQLLAATGDLKEATSLARRALEAAKTIYGPTHPQVAFYSTKLAELMESEDRLPEAERLLITALTINTDYYGNEHWKHHASVAALSRVQATLQSKQYQPVAGNYGLERSTEDENHRTS